MKVIKYMRGVDSTNKYIVKVNPEEALRLIKSLSAQMMKKDSNVGREEFDTEEGEYFTIAVIQPNKEG